MYVCVGGGGGGLAGKACGLNCEVKLFLKNLLVL